jgi:acyl-[acyl-carrier-protein]-phospholipid O-acyltransferase/long-chain-fatty-acid--[acyl-carrier-protein] ligase
MSRRSAPEVLGHQFVRTAKQHWQSFCMADSSGRTQTFGRALVAGLLLSRWLRRHATNESTIGLLLPASVGGALANIATTLAGKVPVNVNFTAGPDAVAHAIKRSGITTTITSRVFLAKAQIEPIEGMVYLEDITREIGRASSLLMLIAAYVLPAPLLTRLFLDNQATAGSTATIIFSSGSTGVPKGVMLTHRNILSNLDAIGQIFTVTRQDVIIGVLPFFHSFGFTATLWFPLIAGFGAIYHPNPTDAKTIGELAERYRGTLLISTPTFCATYIRKCKPQQFAHLRIAMVGAEKLREPIASAFRDKFGTELLEGYGCTEMAPVVSANVPETTAKGVRRGGIRPGSVGRPLPGVAAQVVDLDTRAGPLIGKEGLLLVKGPNMMAGYLDDAAQTREVMLRDWYVTGDIAMIDADGFIHITDRLSRFSKIAGEMVPHMKIEESITALLGESYAAAVSAVSDPSKGERLVAFYTDPTLRPQEIWERLSRLDLPKLWVPKREDLHFVESIPTLGSGKVDLGRVRQLAMERSRATASSSPQQSS